MKKSLFILFLIYIGIVSIYAQKTQTEICIDFRVGSYHIDPNYMDNKVRLAEIIASIDQLKHETDSNVSQLIACGISSPDTVTTSAKPDPEKWTRRIHLKTNTIGLAMLITNIGAEIDLAPRWSFNFPIYFSAFNYFTSKVKFRTLAFQPELRHWFSCEREGWFAGAHLGLGWFNYAKGDWRYQDHRRRTPLYGGGLNAGYRKPISKDGRWLLEFSLGGGIYHLNYDIFHNEPNGRLAGNRKRTFYGVDNAAVSFVYRFDLKKGGKE